MKIYVLCICMAFCFLSIRCLAQNSDTIFTGAKVNLTEYKAVYQLDNASDSVIKMTFHNIQNALSDERQKGKVKIELVAHGAGIAAFMKSSPYEAQLLNLKQQGVLLAYCLNTLREKNISKDQLFSFLSYSCLQAMEN